MSYSDEWIRAVIAATAARNREPDATTPTEPAPVESTTWKPWAQMTAEERRKALAERERERKP